MTAGGESSRLAARRADEVQTQLLRAHANVWRLQEMDATNRYCGHLRAPNVRHGHYVLRWVCMWKTHGRYFVWLGWGYSNQIRFDEAGASELTWIFATAEQRPDQFAYIFPKVENCPLMMNDKPTDTATIDKVNGHIPSCRLSISFNACSRRLLGINPSKASS